MPVLATVRETRSADTTARYVTAARLCFARDGVARTRMGTVAEQAGVARPTVYKAIASREELLELVLAARTAELVEQIVRRAARRRRSGLEDDLVEFFAITVEEVRDDPEFAEVANAMRRAQAFRFLAGPSELRGLLIDCLEPWFDRAEAEGRLRDLPREELAGLVQIVMAPLAAQPELSAEELRRTLRHLLCPALLTPS